MRKVGEVGMKTAIAKYLLENNVYKDRGVVHIPMFYYDQIMDALKEQEAVEPIYNEEKYGDHLPHCGNCEKVLPNNAVYGKVNFCHYCGQAVKWSD